MQAMLLTTIGVTGVVIVEVDWRVGKRDAVLVEGKERRARARLEGRERCAACAVAFSSAFHLDVAAPCVFRCQSL